MKLKHKIPPGRLIIFGFLGLILLGTFLLWLPITHNEGKSVSLVDALFLSTSATCVTGLSPLVVNETFNTFGKGVFAFLIQIGGLGVACIGASFIFLLRGRMGIKDQSLVREGWNVSSAAGLIKILKMALAITFLIELLGAALCYFVFSQEMSPLAALGTSLFHSISSFNNAGFDILGSNSLIDYRTNIPLITITSFLIIAGGLGFIVYWDIFEKRRFKKLSLHSKVVLTTTLLLLVLGALALLCIGDLSISDSIFYSVSARTAGFASAPMNELSQGSLCIIAFLMFIGASPGSTGGGIKTTTFFALCLTLKSLVRGKKPQAFHRRLPESTLHKALVLVLLALVVLLTSTFILCLLEPSLPFLDLLIEVISAGATVGLSTGITSSLCDLSKLVLSLVMFIGRLGPLTIATVWTIKQESTLSYSEESITIG